MYLLQPIMALQASPKAPLRKLLLSLGAIALGCQDRGGKQVALWTLITGERQCLLGTH